MQEPGGNLVSHPDIIGTIERLAHGTPWTEAEIAILVDAIKAGVPRRQIKRMIPTRGDGAIQDRYLRERRRLGLAPKKAGRPKVKGREVITMSLPANDEGIGPTYGDYVVSRSIERASRELLHRMLRYGLRHGSLLGLSMAQVRIRAKQEGLLA